MNVSQLCLRGFSAMTVPHMIDAAHMSARPVTLSRDVMCMLPVTLINALLVDDDTVRVPECEQPWPHRINSHASGPQLVSLGAVPFAAWV